MLTEQLLDRLTATWRAQGVPVEEALAPGRRVERFESDDGSLHVELPAELRTWWAWHNGVVEGRAGSWPVVPGLRPMTFTESRDWWQRSLEAAQKIAPTLRREHPMPIRATGGGRAGFRSPATAPATSSPTATLAVPTSRRSVASSGTRLRRDLAPTNRLVRPAGRVVDRGARTRPVDLRSCHSAMVLDTLGSRAQREIPRAHHLTETRGFICGRTVGSRCGSAMAALEKEAQRPHGERAGEDRGAPLRVRSRCPLAGCDSAT